MNKQEIERWEKRQLDDTAKLEKHAAPGKKKNGDDEDEEKEEGDEDE